MNIDLIKITESAAISAAKLIGSGNKLEIDRAATEVMRKKLNEFNIRFKVAICEGEKDKSHYFLPGEYFGPKTEKVYSIAIDPVECTTQVSIYGTEALSVVAIAEEDCFYQPKTHYMAKLAYGKEIKKYVKLNIADPVEKIISTVSEVLNKSYDEITVSMLNRPRHQHYIDELRKLGVKIRLFNDGDISNAITTCIEEKVSDLMIGIGGSTESLISAVAIKQLGGSLQCYEVNDKLEQSSNVLDENTLITSDCAFVATGIISGNLLNGVKFNKECTVNSLFISDKISYITTKYENY